MVNVWDYIDATVIKLTSISGESYQGKVIDVTDAEDEAEESGTTEDSIVIDVEGNYIGFEQSTIESIEVIK